MLSTTPWAAALFIWAVVSAGVAAALGHKADQLADRIRTEWNRFIRTLARSFPDVA